MADQTAIPIGDDGGATLSADGYAPLVDPTAADCCCQCPPCVDETTRQGEANSCEMCNAGGTDTPLTWAVTIPAQVLRTGCHGPCEDAVTPGATPDASWNLTGSYAGGTYCLTQIAPCVWAYDEAFSDAVVTAYEEADCTGTATNPTDRLTVGLAYDPISNTLSLSVVIYNSSGGASPFSATNIVLFESAIHPDAADKICCNGSDVPSLEPLGNIEDPDPECPLGETTNAQMFTTQTTARIDPCCEAPSAPDFMSFME